MNQNKYLIYVQNDQSVKFFFLEKKQRLVVLYFFLAWKVSFFSELTENKYGKPFGGERTQKIYLKEEKISKIIKKFKGIKRL